MIQLVGNLNKKTETIKKIFQGHSEVEKYYKQKENRLPNSISEWQKKNSQIQRWIHLIYPVWRQKEKHIFKKWKVSHKAME